MIPDEMSDRLAEWAAETWSPVRRVACVEPEGPRRTWALYEGGRQVGNVRMRHAQQEYGYDTWLYEWTVEASDRTRAMLGL